MREILQEQIVEWASGEKKGCVFLFVLNEFDTVFDDCVILEFFVGSYRMVHVFSEFVRRCCSVIN